MTRRRLSIAGRTVAFAVLFGVFLTLAGGGTRAGGSFAVRVAELTVIALVAYTMGHVLTAWAGRRSWPGRRIWIRALVVAVIMTVPMGLVVWCLDSLVLRTIVVGALPTYIGVSLVISLLMCLISALAIPSALMPERQGRVPSPQGVRFLDRLPPRLRGADVWAVEAEDHYLRVHTSKGQDLILVRLSDAIAELQGIEGAQAHRSWWVARDAVTDAKRMDGRAVLTLQDGSEVPVSRSYAKILREKGWF